MLAPELLKLFLYLFILAVFARLLRPLIIRFKGKLGEQSVKMVLSRLDSSHYKIIHDLLLPFNNNTDVTQIDHVIVSEYGVFCIETKAHKGWIFGNSHQKNWTQVIYKHKERFYNPLRQNYAHTQALQEHLVQKFPQASVIPLVVFAAAGKLKFSGKGNVILLRDLLNFIEQYQQPLISPGERVEIYNMLLQLNLDSTEARNLHKHLVGLKKMRNG